MDHRRAAHPRAGPASFAARRRADALARQRAARGDAVDAARAARAAGVAEEAAPAVVDASPPARGGRADLGWRALTLHEWLIDAPASLSSEWMVAPRPEGVRVVVTARGGRTVARSRSGAPLLTFASRLPGGGGGADREGAHAGCVLDCVFQPDAVAGAGVGGSEVTARPSSPAGGTFFAIDVLEWSGRDLETCTAEFRTFWCATQLAECGAAAAPAARSGGLPPAAVVPLVFAAATPAAVAAAARAPTPFTRDGILLLHRDGGYVAGAPNPLALAWKDGACSRHVVDTDPSTGRPSSHLTAVLRVSASGDALETGDDPPVALCAVPAGLDGAAAPGRLVRVVAAGGATADAATGAAALHGVAPSPAPPPRGRAGRADTLSKLLFQSAARAGAGVGLEALVGGGEAMTE